MKKIQPPPPFECGQSVEPVGGPSKKVLPDLNATSPGKALQWSVRYGQAQPPADYFVTRTQCLSHNHLDKSKIISAAKTLKSSFILSHGSVTQAGLSGSYFKSH